LECFNATLAGFLKLDRPLNLFYRQRHFQTHLSEEKNFMNKNDLVAAVTQATDISKADASNAVDAVLDTITDALKSGDGVQLIGFGNFSVADRAAREGRNPRTGETIQIAASKQPKFKAGKALKDAVNG
jgi:DNA-binding protein HU-beta